MAILTDPIGFTATAAHGAAWVPLSILIAEDVKINQLLLTTMLERLGHRAELAVDGGEAVRRVEQATAEWRSFDLVLMDIQMPRVDGLEATRMIRSLGFDADNLPIIALSANAYADDIAACHAAGMQGHLVKPLSRAELEAALARWAGRSARQAPATDRYGEDIDPALYGLYATRKAALLERLDAMIQARRFGDEDSERMSGDLHQLAGVAALFGEPQLGALAATLERNILEWTQAERATELVRVAQKLRQAA